MPRESVKNVPPASRAILNYKGDPAQGLSVAIRKVVVSNSGYHVVAPFNTYRLREATPATFTITVPPGTYDAISFPAAVVAAMTGIGAANNYAATLSADTGLLTVTGNVVNFSFWLANEPRMAAIMGFAAADPAPAGLAITGAFPVRLSPSYFELHCRELARAPPTGPSINGPIVALIDGGTRFTSTTHDEPEENYYHFAGGGPMEFYLVDEFGLEVNLNNGLLAIDLVMHNPTKLTAQNERFGLARK